MSAPLVARRDEGRGVLWDADVLSRSPLYWAVREAGAWLASSAVFPMPEEIDARLATRAGVRFERQAPTPRRARQRHRKPRDPSSMYDARIAAGAVPTRPGSWHDLMNALVWATFPRAKRALHARQHTLVVPGAPARVRPLDGLALVDEGGVVVAMRSPVHEEEAVVEALARGEARAVVFGHAIYEGIAVGRPLPFASAFVIAAEPRDDGLLGAVDEALPPLISGIQDPRELMRLPLMRVVDRGNSSPAALPTPGA